MTHICISKLTIISSDNGLSPGRRQATIWTNAGILLIGPLVTNFNETSIKIHTFSFKKIHLNMSSGKWRPFCLGLNVLRQQLVTSEFNTKLLNPIILTYCLRQKIHSNEIKLSMKIHTFWKHNIPRYVFKHGVRNQWQHCHSGPQVSNIHCWPISLGKSTAI